MSSMRPAEHRALVTACGAQACEVLATGCSMGDTGCNIGAQFSFTGANEIGRRDSQHLDVHVDAVEQRLGNPCLIITLAVRAVQAVIAKLAGYATAILVHGGNTLDAGMVRDTMAHSDDHSCARLQRPAHGIEHLRREFCNLLSNRTSCQANDISSSRVLSPHRPSPQSRQSDATCGIADGRSAVSPPAHRLLRRSRELKQFLER